MLECHSPSSVSSALSLLSGIRRAQIEGYKLTNNKPLGLHYKALLNCSSFGRISLTLVYTWRMARPGDIPRTYAFFLQQPINSMIGPETLLTIASVVELDLGDHRKLKSSKLASLLMIEGLFLRALPRKSRSMGL